MHAHRPPFSLLCALAAILPVVGGCDAPEFEGPQIQSPPPAFTLRPDTYQEYRMFPDREIIHHDAWVEAAWGNFSGIYINGHAGTVTQSDVEDARNAAMDRIGRPVDFSGVEALRVDGRTGWGWTELWQTPERGLEYVAYRAVIPYDTISYAVEFITGEPGLKQRPDSLKAIVASFAVGKTTYNLPLIAVLAGVGLFIVVQLRSHRQEAARRAASITLKKYDKNEDEAEGREEPATGTPPSKESEEAREGG